VSGLRLAGSTETADLASFLGRLGALDPAAVVRLRSAAARVTAYARLPFGVLVSRTVRGDAAPGDVTVRAGDLLTLLDHEPLGYPSRFGLDPKSVKGDVAIDLGMVVPTWKNLDVDQIAVTAAIAATADIMRKHEQVR